jgi:hypothetical protein
MHRCDEKCWLENLKGREHVEDLGLDCRIILIRILGKYGGNLRTGFSWLSVGRSGRIL